MYLIDTVSREDAKGVVSTAYDLIPAQIDIPVPLRIMSASPRSSTPIFVIILLFFMVTKK